MHLLSSIQFTATLGSPIKICEVNGEVSLLIACRYLTQRIVHGSWARRSAVLLRKLTEPRIGSQDQEGLKAGDEV
jgi:hypothetical protein